MKNGEQNHMRTVGGIQSLVLVVLVFVCAWSAFQFGKSFGLHLVLPGPQIRHCSCP